MSRYPLERQRCADKREEIRWSLEPPKNSNKFPSYKTGSDDWEVEQKVVDGRGGGGGSDPTDLDAKIKKKREKKRKNERERTTLPRSGLFWSRSPSPGGEGRRRSPDPGWKRLGGFRMGWFDFSLEASWRDYSSMIVCFRLITWELLILYRLYVLYNKWFILKLYYFFRYNCIFNHFFLT